MTATRDAQPSRWAAFVAVFLRWLLGACFIFAGLNKVLQPVEFLQSMRLYGVLDRPIVLNLVAALLPWLEIFFGGLLVAGIAVRGVSVLLIGLLVPFTVLVVQRALAVQAADAIPFCAIRFDCGCGTGERFVCGKVAENLFLLILAGAVLGWSTDRWCARYSLVKPPPSAKR